MNSYYYCKGPIRGACGHHHRTITGAARCLRSDQRGCNPHGQHYPTEPYSDRDIWLHGPDGRRIMVEPAEEV